MEPQSADFKNENAAFYFFTYLVMFLSLAFLATGVGAILFQLINKYIDDPLASNYSAFSSSEPIKYGIASVLIAGPLFFFLASLINKHLFQGKISENSKVRRWLTYIILFFAAATIIGDLISLVFNLLDGDIVLRFILKVATVLAIAGAIFGYYFWDMRHVGMTGQKFMGNKAWAAATIVLSTIVFISAFFVVDSPATARDKKFDEELVNYMNSAQYDIESYYRDHSQLPARIEDVDISNYGPNMESSVSYQKTGDAQYKLCGSFKRSNLLDEENDGVRLYEPGRDWKHDRGIYCFPRTVEVEFDSNAIKPMPAPIQ